MLLLYACILKLSTVITKGMTDSCASTSPQALFRRVGQVLELNHESQPRMVCTNVPGNEQELSNTKNVFGKNRKSLKYVLSCFYVLFFLPWPYTSKKIDAEE